MTLGRKKGAYHILSIPGYLKIQKGSREVRFDKSWSVPDYSDHSWKPRSGSGVYGSYSDGLSFVVKIYVHDPGCYTSFPVAGPYHYESRDPVEPADRSGTPANESIPESHHHPEVLRHAPAKEPLEYFSSAQIQFQFVRNHVYRIKGVGIKGVGDKQV